MVDHPFTEDDLAEMMYDLPDGWEYAPFGKPHITGQSRWRTNHAAVIHDGNVYYRLTWATGSTEYQDDDDAVAVSRVYPHEVTITEYRSKP